MPRIKNMGTATMRFNEGVVVSGSVETPDHAFARDVAIVSSGTLEFSAMPGVRKVIRILSGDDDKEISFQTSNPAAEIGKIHATPGMSLIVSGADSLDLQSGIVLINSGGAASSLDPTDFSDTNFFVSGSIDSMNTTVKGTSVFGGDLHVSGATQINSVTITSTGRVGIGMTDPDYKLEVGGSMAVGEYIRHRNDSNTHIHFEEDKITLKAGGYAGLVLEESLSGVDRIYLGGPGDDTASGKKYAQVLVMSGGSGTSDNEANYSDTNFFVSGSTGSRGTNIRGTSVFGGDMSVSGTIGVGSISILELADDDIPPHVSNFGEIYAKSSDSKLYFKNDGGTEYDLTLGAGSVAGNDGNVLYNNAGSMAGSNFLIFDDVNNRLGINQTSPQHRLDVAGSVRFAGSATFQNGTITVDENTSFLNSSDSNKVFLTPVLGGRGSNSYGTALLNTHNSDLLLSSSVDIKIDASGPGVSTGKIHFDETGANRAYLELGSTPRFHSNNHLSMSAANDIELNAEGGQIFMSRGSISYLTFNIDDTPEIDVSGDFTIDVSGDVVIDSSDDFIIKNSTVQRMQVEDLTGDVAIGNHDPAYRLDVRDTVSSGFVASFENDSTDDNSDVLRLKLSKGGSLTTDNSFIDLIDGDGDVNGRIRGNGSGGITYSSAFTGQHPTSIVLTQDTTVGMIVESTGEVWSKNATNMETGIPKVAVTNTQNSKKVFGVIANLSGTFEGMVKVSNQSDGETHIEVNSIGEGLVWVTNINGNIENGDYITSSPIFGIGQKQSDDILRSCTVAKCTEQINWSAISENITYNGVSYKKHLTMCTYHCG